MSWAHGETRGFLGSWGEDVPLSETAPTCPAGHPHRTHTGLVSPEPRTGSSATLAVSQGRVAVLWAGEGSLLSPALPKPMVYLLRGLPYPCVRLLVSVLMILGHVSDPRLQTNVFLFSCRTCILHLGVGLILSYFCCKSEAEVGHLVSARGCPGLWHHLATRPSFPSQIAFEPS